jgi:hypothetical protein
MVTAMPECTEHSRLVDETDQYFEAADELVR